MRKEREKIIFNFQKDPTKQLILISLKAGGTGLNLVEATNVIHYDLWWNPAVEDQATDRAYRIGQTKNVQVHRLITLGTFEEKINSIIQGKRSLTDLTLIKGEKWITELSNEELKELFVLTGGVV
jgi:SNF2 family DNA or RNA helicase